MDIKFIGLAFFLAFLTESLVEYFLAKPMDLNPVVAKYKPFLIYIAALVGVGLAFVYQIDLIAALFPGSVSSPVGYILSGIIIGRGSNYLHDLVELFKGSVSNGKK